MPASVDSRASAHSPYPTAGSSGTQAPRTHALALSPHATALRRARHGYQQTTPPWLISYADLITLLLCFFILLTGASRVEQHNLQPVMASLADQFSGVLDRGTQTEEDGASSIGDIRLVKERVQSLIANAMPLALIRHSSESNRLEVELPESGLFQSGGDDLSALGRSRLKNLLAVIGQGTGATPYRLEYRLAQTDMAAHRAAVLGSETVAAGTNATGVGVAIDKAETAGKLILRIELGGKTEEGAAP
ncbi:MAG: flagellar motor protein MotB [Hypericibacter sp.]